MLALITDSQFSERNQVNYKYPQENDAQVDNSVMICNQSSQTVLDIYLHECSVFQLGTSLLHVSFMSYSCIVWKFSLISFFQNLERSKVGVSNTAH